jgi:hypothetical protein
MKGLVNTDLTTWHPTYERFVWHIVLVVIHLAIVEIILREKNDLM